MTDGPKLHRRHGFYILVMVIGWVLPPIAVLLRFGFGTDFFLNILLTLCGYIPGHGHNFYLQNIRNNHNKKRTPAWATKAGLVKDPTIKRKAKTQWANRYDERTPTRADGYQDDDDELTNNSNNTGNSKIKQGQVPLLEPESYINQSSSSQQLVLNHDNLDSNQSNSFKNYHLTHLTNPNLSSTVRPTRTKTSIPLNSKKSNSLHDDFTNNNNNKNKGTGSTRRNHFDPLSTDLDPLENHHHDPYFIRRASTIHVSSTSSTSKNNQIKSTTIHSPNSVKSFSTKLGFGSKNTSNSNHGDQDVDFLGINRSHEYQIMENHLDAEDDGLNHQF